MIDIETLIAQGINWTEQPISEQQNSARGFIGVVGNWRFVVASFDIEQQGFPPGSRGYDGTVVGERMIIRIPRPEAQILVEDAIEKLS